MDTAILQLRQWIQESRNMVFFGGAGVSTESGIPDFRSAKGIYSQNIPIPPETIVSHHFFQKEPQAFFDFYKSHLIYTQAQPNPAHVKLAQWEREGRLRSVVTQNIDGLHQAAGSRRVWELHGSIWRNHCVKCHASYPLSAVLEQEGVPRCHCGGIIKPDVVLYEESLDPQVLNGAILDISQADLLLIGGTSLAVYPAAGLVEYYRGNRLVIINRSPTPYDQRADLVLTGSIGEILAQV